MSVKLKKYLTIMLAVILIAAMTSCSNEKHAVELSDAELESLMEQTAKKTATLSYTDYLRDEPFAAAEVFGVQRNGDEGNAYVYLLAEEYVVVKDKAYLMSGRSGEAVITFSYEDTGVELVGVRWSEDGEGRHDYWLKKNFPHEYLDKVKEFRLVDADGNSKISEAINETAAKKLGVPVETENILTIDTEEGTYEIVKTLETEDGSFDTEIIDKGNLKDLSGKTK